MPREMFGEVNHRAKSNLGLAMPISATIILAVAVGIFVQPLLAATKLPEPPHDVFLRLIAAIPVPPEPIVKTETPKTPTPTDPKPPIDYVPTEQPPVFSPVPRDLPRLPTTERLPFDLPRGPGGDRPFILTPPPVAEAPRERGPVRVSSGIREPRKIFDVKPVYPPPAQAARLEGLVIIEATIGKDGRVINAKALRSHPMFEQSALDAVRQWRFTPTTLSGEPVEVILTVTVNFNLH